ncbi:hypothetical protein D3C84_1236740 [compost metagenome]
MRGPYRCPVFADGRAEAQAFELLQRSPRADSPGEKLCLPFGDGTPDAGWRLDVAALEIIEGEL